MFTSRSIDDWFDHHPPKNPLVVRSHEVAREAAKVHAHLIDALLPEGPEKTLALRGLKSVLALANEAIALEQVEYVDPGEGLRDRLRELAEDL